MSFSLSTTRAEFSTLPVELREQIWLETFVPRTLELLIHQTYREHQWPLDEKATIEEKTTGHPMGRTFGPVSIHFTATILSPTSDPQNGQASGHLDHHQHHGMPTGPVALSVCRESRALALARYTASFAGTQDLIMAGPTTHKDAGHEEWERHRCGEKRIWVDFTQDTLLPAGSTGCRSEFLLSLLYQHAGAEIQRIQRLAFRGYWTATDLWPSFWALETSPGMTLVWFNREPPRPGIPQWRYAWDHRIWAFSALTELVVWDNWGHSEKSPEALGSSVDEVREILARELMMAYGNLESRGWPSVPNFQFITFVENNELLL